MPTLKLEKHRKLHYQLIPGDADKPYLVFLHEGLGCIGMWHNFPDLLCKATGCPGLVYDRLGYGKSSPMDHSRTIHYLHEYALQELPRLLEGVIPETPFILIGHSDGGSIGLILAAERPAFLLGVISEAAHVFVDRLSISGIEIAKAAWADGKFKGLAKYHGEKTEDVFRAWSETWLSKWFRHWNIEYLLPSIEVPMLVLQGESDQYGLLDQVKMIASKSSGYARLEIVKNCAHVPHLEAQSNVLELMAEFIAEVSRDR